MSNDDANHAPYRGVVVVDCGDELFKLFCCPSPSSIIPPQKKMDDSLLYVGPDYITKLLSPESSGANQSGKRRRKRGEKAPAAADPIHSSSSSSSKGGPKEAGTVAGDDGVICRAVKRIADPYTAIVFLCTGEACAVSGACALTLLKGTRVSINGYVMTPGVVVDVVAPPWQPAAALHADAADAADTEALNTATKRSKTTPPATAQSLLEAALGGQAARAFTDAAEAAGWWRAAAAAVLVRGAPLAHQEWLVAAEDQGAYQQLLSSAADKEGGREARQRDAHAWRPVSADLVSVASAVAGSAPAVAALLGNDILALPRGWADSVGRVAADSARATSVRRGTRAVVCGAKGVGKSTCLRYTINRLLTTSSSSSSSSSSPSSSLREVAVIDCDLGQPEFNLPGVIGLHIVTAPVLTPPHLHLGTPEVSFFVGDLTTKHEPEAFAVALDLLMRRYEECRGARIARQVRLSGRAAPPASRPANPRVRPLPRPARYARYVRPPRGVPCIVH